MPAGSLCCTHLETLLGEPAIPLWGRSSWFSWASLLTVETGLLPSLSATKPWHLLSFLQGFLLCVCVCLRVINRVRLFETPQAIAHQAPLSMEFSRWYQRGLSIPTPEDLPKPGIELTSCVSCTDRRILYHSTTWEAKSFYALLYCYQYTLTV